MNETHKATVLAIDDSLTIRKLVDLILGKAGYKVVVAENGATGLRMAFEHKPDLILLDYVLPDVPSPEICRQLLENPDTAQTPVLLISTNGAAIRQLYTDSRNVKDYLTKPFQAKVLESVIEHLLTRREVAKNSLGDDAVILESDGGIILTAENGTSSAPAGTETAKSTGSRPIPGIAPVRTATSPGLPKHSNIAGRAAAVSNDSLSFLRNLLNNRFRNLARMIPELETRRGRLPAETYYLPFLLRNELLTEISAEMGRAQITAERGEPLIAGTADWMSIDSTLMHLGRTRATGVFSLRLKGENIDLMLEQGTVTTITSDNAKAYCAEAAFDFRSLPPASIASAVAAQKRSKLPFFITLKRSGILTDHDQTMGLLHQQGARAVYRAISTPGVRYAFIPRTHSGEPGEFSLNLSPRQIILEALRFVDDWLEIESTTGSVDTVFRVASGAPDILEELTLTQSEQVILDMTDGLRPISEVSCAVGLGLYETCAAVYRFIRLQILIVETSVAPIPEVNIDDFLGETGNTPWQSSNTPFPTSTDTPNQTEQTPWPKF